MTLRLLSLRKHMEARTCPPFRVALGDSMSMCAAIFFVGSCSAARLGGCVPEMRRVVVNPAKFPRAQLSFLAFLTSTLVHTELLRANMALMKEATLEPAHVSEWWSMFSFFDCCSVHQTLEVERCHWCADSSREPSSLLCTRPNPNVCRLQFYSQGLNSSISMFAFSVLNVENAYRPRGLSHRLRGMLSVFFFL